MKKNLKKMILTILILVCAVALILVLFLEAKYSLRHYFDDWEAEIDEKIASVCADYLVKYPDSDKFEDLHIGFPCALRTVYSIENGRIYALAQQDSQDGAKDKWIIMSMKTDKTDAQIHYETEVSDYEKYYDLANSAQKELNSSCGGMYDNHHIYIKAYDRIVAYDIVNDTVEAVEDLPESEYCYRIEKSQKIIISKQGEEDRILTLDKMALTNEYAAALFSLRDYKAWSGRSFVDAFFRYIRELNGKLYVVCQVHNRYGKSFAIVFQYDYDTDSVYYVTSSTSGEYVSMHYSFIPIYEE